MVDCNFKDFEMCKRIFIEENFQDEKLTELFKDADKDSDGKISFGEAKAIWKQVLDQYEQTSHNEDEAFQQLFEKFDVDGDKYLNRIEFGEYMKEVIAKAMMVADYFN